MSLRVVIAVDESAQADGAFKYYMDHLHRPGSEVIVAHIAEPPTANISHPLPADQWKLMVMELEQHHKQIREKFCGPLKEKEIPYQYIGSEGKPGQEICEIVEDKGASFVVLGTRGQGKMRRTILGSVSDYVLHHSRAPVMICRD